MEVFTTRTLRLVSHHHQGGLKTFHLYPKPMRISPVFKDILKSKMRWLPLLLVHTFSLKIISHRKSVVL